MSRSVGTSPRTTRVALLGPHRGVALDAGGVLDGLQGLERAADAGHTELGPHDLSVLVDRHAPPRAERARPAGCRDRSCCWCCGSGGRVFWRWRRGRDAYASGGTADRHRDRCGAMLTAFASSSAATTVASSRVPWHRVPPAGRARSGGRRARRPARRRARRSRRRRERSSTPRPIPAAAELAAAGRVRLVQVRLARSAGGASAKTVDQSYFMLTTVQSWPRARSSASSAPAV